MNYIRVWWITVPVSLMSLRGSLISAIVPGRNTVFFIYNIYNDIIFFQTFIIFVFIYNITLI